MIEFHKNVSLQHSNTLGIDCVASNYCDLNSATDIQDIVEFAECHNLAIRVLGEGSNLILPDKLDVLVVKSSIKCIEVISETGLYSEVKVGAGENWHSFVCWAVHNGLSGIENLAYIPGTVGAAPVQNIGAYGVEVSHSLKSIHVFDLEDKSFKVLPASECDFGYRNSLFKANENRFVILELVFQLSKKYEPILNYGSLNQLLEAQSVTLKEAFDAIVAVRQSKLPEPKELPNAGSFFKNPVVVEAVFANLQVKYPNIVGYPDEAGVKVAAGWLIDEAGLKGRSNANGVGCYDKQALVLVNPQKVSSTEVMAWARYVAARVFDLFEIELEVEPRVW